jgi:hypothetical protein
LPGSDSVGPGDEQRKVIRFPRSAWMAEDGVEPLTGGHTRPADSTTAGAKGSSEELDAFEPDDFWASGETQQFVRATGSGEPVTDRDKSRRGTQGRRRGPRLIIRSPPAAAGACRWRGIRAPRFTAHPSACRLGPLDGPLVAQVGSGGAGGVHARSGGGGERCPDPCLPAAASRVCGAPPTDDCVNRPEADARPSRASSSRESSFGEDAPARAGRVSPEQIACSAPRRHNTLVGRFNGLRGAAGCVLPSRPISSLRCHGSIESALVRGGINHRWTERVLVRGGINHRCIE